MTDNFARIILLIWLLTMMPIAAYHRLKARTDERLDRRQEGWFILFTLRPLAAVMMAALVAFLVRPSWMAWASVPLSGWLRWLGVALGVAASALLFWTMHTLGHNLTDTVVTRRNASLVTHGPYRWVRHPFYIAVLLGVLANSLVTANWFIATTGIGAFLLLALRASTEERNLVARFGNEYEEYVRRTGRFFPRFG
jgi:protein-S-isoprenylcysteine O-methyltransferase Ste14